MLVLWKYTKETRGQHAARVFETPGLTFDALTDQGFFKTFQGPGSSPYNFKVGP